MIPENETIGDRLTRWIYAVGPSGLSPIAPGTAGSFTAAILLYLPGNVPGIPPWTITFALVSFVVVLGLGVWSGRKAEHIHGKDPGIVVIDEVAGMVVTMVGIENSIPNLIIAFFAFRAMDILKPPPVRAIERAPGSWGVMLDDVGAGIYSNIIVRLVLLAWGALA